MGQTVIPERRSQPAVGWFLATALVALLAGAMVSLGLWQLRRLGERRAHNAEIERRMAFAPIPLPESISDPSSLDYRPVTAEGMYDPAQEIILRGQTYDEAPGVHLITPLRLTDGNSAVLVDRGWIPYDYAAPDKRAVFPPPRGVVTVDGIARVTQTRPSSLAPLDPPLAPGETRLDAWFRVDIERIRQQTPYPLLPVFVEQKGSTGNAQLPIPNDSVDLTDGPHLSYAIQWFSFATTLSAGYFFFVLRQRKGSSLGPRR